MGPGLMFLPVESSFSETQTFQSENFGDSKETRSSMKWTKHEIYHVKEGSECMSKAIETFFLL